MKLSVDLKKFGYQPEDLSFLTETQNGKSGIPLKIVGLAVKSAPVELRNKRFNAKT